LNSSNVDLTTKLHSKTIFSSKVVGDWPLPGQCTIGPNRTDVDTFINRNRLPSPPADFEGREVVMNTLIRHILDRRLISLVGDDGMGKSSVASAVGKYLYDREIFPHGIIFVRAKGLQDFPSFLTAMKNALMKYGNHSIQRKLQELQLHNNNNNTNSSNSSNSNQEQSSSSGLTINTNITNNSNNNNNNNSHSNMIMEEEFIISILSSLKMLIILDNLDDLLADYGDNVTDMRLFLSRLFEQCSQIKILNVSIDTLSMHNINVGFGIIEYSVHLGPLTLNSTLRLFARLTPSLSTAHEKSAFIESLQPTKYLHMLTNTTASTTNTSNNSTIITTNTTSNSNHINIHSNRELNNIALQILNMFGSGNPSKIVHLACESNPESVEALKAMGIRIVKSSLQGIRGVVS
jgi:hypothetical protein